MPTLTPLKVSSLIASILLIGLGAPGSKILAFSSSNVVIVIITAPPIFNRSQSLETKSLFVVINTLIRLFISSSMDFLVSISFFSSGGYGSLLVDKLIKLPAGILLKSLLNLSKRFLFGTPLSFM